jgi:CsoR family transcriptional regulator, copper-sensing transcriptional repressor
MNIKVKKNAIRRLSIAEGHIRKVREMVEKDSYCPDVIHQSQAVQSSLKKVDEIMLDGHLHTCVLHAAHASGHDKEKMMDEILDVFRKGNN